MLLHKNTSDAFWIFNTGKYSIGREWNGGWHLWSASEEPFFGFLPLTYLSSLEKKNQPKTKWRLCKIAAKSTTLMLWIIYYSYKKIKCCCLIFPKTVLLRRPVTCFTTLTVAIKVAVPTLCSRGQNWLDFHLVWFSPAALCGREITVSFCNVHWRPNSAWWSYDWWRKQPWRRIRGSFFFFYVFLKCSWLELTVMLQAKYTRTLFFSL